MLYADYHHCTRIFRNFLVFWQKTFHILKYTPHKVYGKQKNKIANNLGVLSSLDRKFFVHVVMQRKSQHNRGDPIMPPNILKLLHANF